MIFDRNRSEFPSDFHREIWWWAVGIVPLEDSLTDEVKAKCAPEVLEGCRDWHSCFGELCRDMYENAGAYLPASGRQYRDILEKISSEGKIDGDAIVWQKPDWDEFARKINKSKGFVSRSVTLERCVAALSRTGFEAETDGGRVKFYNKRYPKIYRAMKVFENSPRVRETPARHHFAHCEFRQLFKSYNGNHAELMRRAGDESREIADAIHEYCKALKVPRSIHFGIIKYKHEGVRILDYNLYGDEYPTLRLNIGPDFRINPFRKDLDEIFKRISAKKEEIDAGK